MIPDPTDEIKAIRDRLSAECGYDLHRIVEETRRQERESGLTYVTSLEPRKAKNESRRATTRTSSSDSER